MATIKAVPLPYPQAASTSFLAYAIGHNVGVVAFSGAAIRYRMHSLTGLGSSKIAQVVAEVDPALSTTRQLE